MAFSRRKRHSRRPSRKRRGPAIRITPQSQREEDETPTSTVRLRAINPGGGAAAASAAEPADDDAMDLSSYAERIEAAAQRARGKPQPVAQSATTAEAVAPAKQQRRRRSRKAKASAESQRPWYKRRKTWFLIAASLPIIVGMIVGAYIINLVWVGWGAYGDIHEEPVERTHWRVNAEGTPEIVPEEEAQAMLPDWGSGDPINLLLLGVDTRVNEEDPPRSDTTIVVHIDPSTNEVSMMSIPRDLKVFIPGHGEYKFNAAYAFGAATGEEGGGPALVAETIGANFDIPIHYYVTVNFEGFKKIVDTVGGVTVDVQNVLSDNQYPTADLRLTRVYFPTGLQHLNGEEALQYVRTRHADSDLGRSDRQQQVLLELREQALNRDLITQAPELIKSMADTIRTDLDFNQMLALANLGRQIDEKSIARFNLWEEGLLTEDPSEGPGDPYYLIADWDALLERQAEFFGTTPPAEQAEATASAIEAAGADLSTAVQIENATDIIGLAGHSAEILSGAGFTSVTPTDAARLHEQTIIENNTDNPATAQQIARLLGLDESVIQPGNGTEGINVVLGADVPARLIPGDAETESTSP